MWSWRGHCRIFSTSGVSEYTLVILDVIGQFKDGSAVRRERSG